jgi:hypothetical protein
LPILLTETDLRALWQNGRRPLPSFPPGTRLSPAGQDFLKDHGLTLTFAVEAAPGVAVPDLPAVLRAHFEAWLALAALAAAQARHFRLPALAARLSDLASAGLAPFSPLGDSPAAAVLPPDHVMVFWLRFLRAEALSVAALARADAPAQTDLAARLEALAEAVQSLEQRFLSGGLAWSVGAA